MFPLRPPPSRRRSGLAAPAALFLAAACAGASAAGSVDPRIESLVPTSAPAGDAYPLTLRIVGGPFDREGNRVHFGELVIEDVPSPDGTTLVVAVPKSVRRASEVPPEVLQPGTYAVVVETRAGRSEAVLFELTGPPRP